MALEPHPFAPDLMGDCEFCPLPGDHPIHPSSVDMPDEPEVEPAAAPEPITPADAQVPLPGFMADDTPLGLVKTYIAENVDDGVTCPACSQRAQVYRRTITGKMGAFLIELSRRPADEPGGWVYIPAMKHAQGDSVKLRYWGLIEGQVGIRDDGSDRVGYWRILPEGIDFVRGSLTVPKHARVYDGRLLNLDDSAGRVGIRDVLGKRFDYGALMAGLD